ncbi:MAG: Stp1/IreP family PP2C-type Ser/Thr phosphatase [Firmicutes bacterium]|nr:Stp1/IreP family PP2C-type Ser/Thr phosphatase [Bacillota bacterium]MDD3850959.1 Stp1/IreP family PP2C-type Ser/Thr phosphatase [Bacillota bacterium]
MKVGAATDIGLSRMINQDCYYCSSGLNAPHLYIVADGMGGHNGGEIASKISVDTVRSFIESGYQGAEYVKDRLLMIRDAMNKANSIVYNRSLDNQDLEGMGTTLTMALLEEGRLYIGHIGDSRMYLMRDGEYRKLTEDHSLVAQLIKNGSISPEEGDNHPQKNVITRALGVDMTVEMDLDTEMLQKDDTLLLCTDGLTNMLDLDEIIRICSEEKDPQSISETLVEEANIKGGKDNVTAIVVKVGWNE